MHVKKFAENFERRSESARGKSTAHLLIWTASTRVADDCDSICWSHAAAAETALDRRADDERTTDCSRR